MMPLDSRSNSAFSREEEAALVQRALAGDQAACTAIVTTYGPQMMSVARRFLRCESDCNDAVQDALISAFKSLPRFEQSSRLSTWLHRITVNACLMKLRSSAGRKETSIEELLPTFDWRGHYSKSVPAVRSPEGRLEESEMRQMVRAAIDQLPDAYRTVLLLRDIEELDTTETARLLETTENNVKTRLHRARQALRTLLEPMMGAHR
ncbi:MAG TPA: sigma-70 family RNA polymerase sigma factor [Phycisphaerae bacterium]|nr:sigma-70 family RNA polymerase sigma factor [Phycisphaerae bacterium]